MNAEIIERLSKSSDMSHLHRVIEQLTQVMQTDREGEKVRIGMVMMLFQQTVSALCEATRLAQDKSATQTDIERLQRDIENARASMRAILPMQ
ncbi:hypothetical protein WT36_15080 [Burkholderia territorii]|nr:hypothetical protein WT36_15080 [Burkholderia territorii]